MIKGSGRGVKLQARVFKECWKIKTSHEIAYQTSTYYLFMEPLIDFLYELFPHDEYYEILPIPMPYCISFNFSC